MCQVLTTSCGEDVQTNACKLLEVVVIQCHGRIEAVSVRLLFTDQSIMWTMLLQLFQKCSKTSDYYNLQLSGVINGPIFQ